MSSTLSHMLETLEPQLVRSLFMKAKNYDDVIDLTLGDPDLPTPQQVIDAGCTAMKSGKTHYTANAGLMELREVISEDIFRRIGIQYDPKKEIIVTPGAMGALSLASMCLLNPDDEVLILAPHWPNYTNMVRMSLAIPKDIPSYGDENLRTLLTRLEAALSSHTRLLIINSPCNPSGQVLSRDILSGIASFAVAHDLTVISDEVYHTLLFNGKAHESILGLPDMPGRSVLVDSMSKRFCMTGWRVGYAAAPSVIIEKMTELQEHVSSCVAPFAQLAALEAFKTGETDTQRFTDIFSRRCLFTAQRLNQISLLHCAMPLATFYLFVDIRATGLSSMAFALKLLEAEHVALVPGIAFGACAEGFIRIACTVSEEKLKNACERIERFLSGIIQ